MTSGSTADEESGPGDQTVLVDVVSIVETAMPSGVDDERIADLLRSALMDLGESGRWTFGIQFLDDAAMTRAHADFMNIAEPTDIMTFPYDDEDESGPGGDLVISVERATDHAREAGWSVTDELYFLLLHGLLHILGWDDYDPGQRAEMLAEQARLLSAWRAHRDLSTS